MNTQFDYKKSKKDEQVTKLAIDLTGMILDAMTSPKKNHTFYVSKIAVKLQGIIDREVRKRITVGQLRQWLNEHRITDPKKMVTNEEIEIMLGLSHP